MQIILYPATSMRNHPVSDCSADWLTGDHSTYSLTNMARQCFMLRTDPGTEKLGH